MMSKGLSSISFFTLGSKTLEKIAEANAQREDVISQFNTQIIDQRERFNVENQMIEILQQSRQTMVDSNRAVMCASPFCGYALQL